METLWNLLILGHVVEYCGSQRELLTTDDRVGKSQTDKEWLEGGHL